MEGRVTVGKASNKEALTGINRFRSKRSPFLFTCLLSVSRSCCILFALATIVAAGDFSELEKKNGFRDLTFGQSMEGIEGMEHIRRDGVVEIYKRLSDKLEIGPAQLISINYGVFEGKLYSVILRTNTKEENQRLINVLKANYGKYREMKPGFFAFGKGDPKIVSLVAEVEEDGKSMKATFRCIPLSLPVYEAEQKAARAASNDL